MEYSGNIHMLTNLQKETVKTYIHRNTNLTISIASNTRNCKT